MDPLSLSASIIAVLQLTGKLLSYLNDVQHATRDQTQLAVEASNIYSLLVSLRFRVEQSSDHEPWFTAVRNLGSENGPLYQLKAALDLLASRAESSHGIRKLGKQLLWNFEKSEMGDTLDKIERIKTLVSLALSDDLFSLSRAMNKELNAVAAEVAEINDGLTALHDRQQKIGIGVSYISAGVTTLNLRQQEEECHKIEDWLSPVDFRSRQQEILKGAQAGTRQWLFESEKFQKWMDVDRGTLWCPGIPGAGKTVTSSLIINHLQSKYKTSDVAVLCLLCNYRDRAGQSAEIFMANLLKQVIQQKKAFSPELKDLYIEREKGRPIFDKLARLFSHEINYFSKVFVVIDALDETTEHEDIRRLILLELQALPINLLITSRYEKSIEQRLGEAERLDIWATAADVQTYIKARIPCETLFARHIEADPSLEKTVVDKIVEKSQGMFIMARFHMDTLVTKTKRRDVRKALDSLPPELDGVYEQTIERIEGQGKDYSELAKRVLLWVANAHRPLSPVELRHAVAVQPGMTELDDEDLDEQDLLVSVCAGLVVLDTETNTIRFTHYTTQEYFDRKGESVFGDAHALIAMSCVTYLSFADLADTGFHLPDDDPFRRRELFSRYPLTRYASANWTGHARETEYALAVGTVLSFLSKPHNVIRADRLGPRDNLPRDSPSEHLSLQHSALHIAAIPAESRDFFGRTPLYLAAMFDEQRVVEMLVARNDVNVNTQTNSPWLWTPLIAAVDCSSYRVLQTLLQGGADVNLRSRDGTALTYAARKLDTASTKLLLEAGADPNTLSENEIPMVFVIFKAEYLWLDVDGASRTVQLIKLLKEHGVNIKAKDKSKRNLLHAAAEQGNVEAAQILLAEGLDPKAVDDIGQTPLDKALNSLPPQVSFLGFHGLPKPHHGREARPSWWIYYPEGSPRSIPLIALG